MFKVFEAKKRERKNVLELPVNSLPFISLKFFSLLQGATTMNSPNMEILYQLSEMWSALFQGG